MQLVVVVVVAAAAAAYGVCEGYGDLREGDGSGKCGVEVQAESECVGHAHLAGALGHERCVRCRTLCQSRNTAIASQ